MININLEKLSAHEKIDYFEKLYQAIIGEGIKAFKNEPDYRNACHFTIKLCLSVNDYIHSNNILQCYKTKITRNRDSWYHYYSMIIYGKRLPRYFLQKPDKLSQKIKRYLKQGDKEQLNHALINLLMFYVKLYSNYGDVFLQELIYFTNYFKDNSVQGFPAFNKGIDELSAYLAGTIDYEDITFDINSLPFDTNETLPESPENISQGISLTDDFKPYVKNPKVLIIGDLRIGTDKVMAIAKRIGFTKTQVEIVNDFKAIKTYDIGKLRHNMQYCGIVFGPVPHSAKGNDGDNSIIAHVEKTEGYPHHARAVANNELKLTKTSIEKALNEIFNHYQTTK